MDSNEEYQQKFLIKFELDSSQNLNYTFKG